MTEVEVSRAPTLERLPLFRGVDPGVLRRLEARLPVRVFEKGAQVCRERDPVEGFWIVLDGSVNIQKVGRDGRLRILETCGGRSVFGLVPVLDGGTQPATVVARETSHLLFCSTAEVHALVREAPDAGLAIARTFATRLRRLTCEVASACLQSVRSRAAALLVEEAEAQGSLPVRLEGPLALTLSSSQEELAHRIGTEREVFARALRSLRDDGVIEQVRGSVRVLDLERLRAIAWD